MDLLWLDLETNGLDPNKNVILEVACARASLLDPFNITKLYQSTVWFPPDCVKDQDPFIIDMHTKNGLFAECGVPEAPDTWQVEAELLKLIPMVEDKDERTTLAGSSIHFDHEFLKVWMPQLCKRLSHRHYDVSAIKIECQSLGMPRFKKAEAHRAWDDILESVDHAKQCRAWQRGLYASQTDLRR